MLFLCVWISAFECSALGVQKRASGPSDLGAAWHGCYTSPQNYPSSTLTFLSCNACVTFSGEAWANVSLNQIQNQQQTRVTPPQGSAYWNYLRNYLLEHEWLKDSCITEEPIRHHRWWGKKLHHWISASSCSLNDLCVVHQVRISFKQIRPRKSLFPNCYCLHNLRGSYGFRLTEKADFLTFKE